MKATTTISRTSNSDHQRGMTVIGAVILLIIIAFAVLIGMRVVPIYISYFNIREAVEGLKSESGIRQMSAAEIRNSLDKRFYIGYVEVIKARDLKVIKKGNDVILKLVYEDRRPLIGNLDIVAKFNDDIELTQ